MRATKYAPRGSFYVLKRRHCLVEIVERGTGVLVVHLASPIAVSNLTSNTSRRVVGQWGGAGGAICEDHFGVARGGMRVALVGEAFA